MALTIDKVHDRINFLIKKNNWGYVSPPDIDICLDMAQMDLYEEYYGDPSKYQTNRPVPAVVYGKTKKVVGSLRNFITNIVISAVTAPSGLYPIPVDFRDFLDAYITYNDGSDHTIGLDFITESQKAFAINSQVKPISDLANSFIALEEGGYQIYPKQDHDGQLTYLRLPAIPVYGYTQSGRTITYNSGSSTQLEWGDDDIKRIINLAIQYIGMGLEDDKIFQQGRIKDRD